MPEWVPIVIVVALVLAAIGGGRNGGLEGDIMIDPTPPKPKDE